jgi:dTDP-4-dehydrorhamnose reductase
MLGSDAVLLLEERGHDVTAMTRHDLDVTDESAAVAAVAGHDVILNCAAWTAVDDAETHEAEAFEVNAVGPATLARAAASAGARLVHVSTDYVFDGTKPTPYVEWDQPNPRSAYGRSKLGGEQELDPSHAVVRTAWVCGAHGRNMVKTVLGLADRPELAFVDDQRGCPTFTADLAPAIRRLAVQRLPGIFHVTNQGATTWYGFVRDILELAGHDPGKVRPIATADLAPPRPAPRPANSVLDNAALRLGSLPLLPHYRDSLERLLVELGART